jgi:nucleotide-binding universal stress UspA family protein
VNRRIVIAVDESEHSRRAVEYVAGIMAGSPDVRITVLHVIPRPPEDLFASGEQRAAWRAEREGIARHALEDYGGILLSAGFPPGSVMAEVVATDTETAAEGILGEVRNRGAGTVVVSRRGVSKKEEFLFGSTSNTLIHQARDCAVWVVE